METAKHNNNFMSLIHNHSILLQVLLYNGDSVIRCFFFTNIIFHIRIYYINNLFYIHIL